jgi:hypothetical protein
MLEVKVKLAELAFAGELPLLSIERKRSGGKIVML